jgi:hypothetical protein
MPPPSNINNKEINPRVKKPWEADGLSDKNATATPRTTATTLLEA